MQIKGRQIDHIVYSVPNLEASLKVFEKNLGIIPTIGGKHLSKGTHNALINLGNECYLEILAIDESNTAVSAPRWMGIDYLQGSKITRWSLKSTQIEKDSELLQRYNPDMGNIIEGNRALPSGETLSWKMTEPLSSPEVDLLPFMLDWSKSKVHPTEQLSQQCLLLDLEFYHPNSLMEQECFDEIFDNLEIKSGAEVQISATLSGPKGLMKI